MRVKGSPRSNWDRKRDWRSLNGTQVSTALALARLVELETVFAAAMVSGVDLS